MSKKSKVDIKKAYEKYRETGSYTKTCDWINETFDVYVSPQLLRGWYVYDNGQAPEDKEMKILLFDIETAPMKVYSWGLFNQDISLGQIVDDWYVLMWAAKWYGDDTYYFDALNQQKGYNSGNDGEYDVVASLWELLDEADIVVAQNGSRFDIRKMNAKFIEYNMPAPSHYKVVDTYKIAKSNFAFTSHKLDYMGDLLVNSKKNKTDFQLWVDCMRGDEGAWKTMIDYCIQDVNLLEEVYTKIRPWDKYHPKVKFSDKRSCNVCGSENLQMSGEYHTAASTFEIFKCGDCNHQQRSRQNVALKDEKDKREVNI